ncbi:hypothetical protein E2C01_017111 [Portunus trituberculatus]|uniref:Uncharacterized protein n=1 Tax=Portunus trituberculatus TaxID=210409 RepID=A0A5B7DR12_PORTR|nr:hypothetical protein [Portunus trituberculatus]
MKELDRFTEMSQNGGDFLPPQVDLVLRDSFLILPENLTCGPLSQVPDNATYAANSDEAKLLTHLSIA